MFNNSANIYPLFLSIMPRLQHFRMNKLLYLAVIALIASCTNDDKPGVDPGKTGGDTGTSGTPTAANPARSISYSVLNTYPHDTSSFTQGLQIYKGGLYEGTGEWGHSHLLKVDLKSGKIEKQVSLDAKFFGEGITILNDTVYQLTWKEKTVLVYTLKDFKKVKEFPLNYEGWGITNNGKELIASDGSSNLYYYNPVTFQLLRTQSISENGSPAFNLNELEYIDGFVYANQWQYAYILKIDPESGNVVGKVDVTDIWNRVKAKDPAVDVPNGIAYDEATKKIYITGKRWPELYEIQLGQ